VEGETPDLDEESSFKKFKEDDVDFDDASVSNLELLARLREVDPKRAAELHPNDRRKIIRSLQGENSYARSSNSIQQQQSTSAAAYSGSSSDSSTVAVEQQQQ
jgi:tRNA A37 N6-isopentenylltransferase MiaA